jgi:TatA/E family protein of Tat protein translocase
MELFAFLGTQEIVVVLVIALIIFGPQKLPEIGRQVGSAMRELRKMTGDVQRALEFDDHMGSTVSTYDSAHWYDSVESPAIAAPQGTTVAQASTAGMLASAESSYEVASEGMGGFVAPPGPPALTQQQGALSDGPFKEL